MISATFVLKYDKANSTSSLITYTLKAWEYIHIQVWLFMVKNTTGWKNMKTP